MSTALEKLKAKHAKEIELFEKKELLLAGIPSDIVSPLIVFNGGPYFGTDGTLVFKGSPEELYQVCLAFEQEWEIVKPSGVKYGNYRISEFPSLTPPSERGNVKLKSSHEIFPVFIDLSVGEGFSTTRTQFYAKNSDGKIYSVELERRTKFYLTARRHEYRGGWSYVSGTAKTVNRSDLKAKTYTYRNTEKSIAGIVHFPADMDMTPSELVKEIMS